MEGAIPKSRNIRFIARRGWLATGSSPARALSVDSKNPLASTVILASASFGIGNRSAEASIVFDGASAFSVVAFVIAANTSPASANGF